MKICYILTAPQMIGFLRGHIETMRLSGFTPTIFCPEESAQARKIALDEGAEVIIVKIKREISPWHDFASTARLLNHLTRLRPDITVTIGPKAGLLGGVAACIAGVPCRIQTKWGIRLETTKGGLRLLLIIADKIAGYCAQLILCDSKSGKDRTAELGLAPAEKIKVMGNGSANGIDTKKFLVNEKTQASAKKFRQDLGVTTNAPLVGFVGRLNLDKGLIELAASWAEIKFKRPDAILVIIGEDECKTVQEKFALKKLQQTSDVKVLGLRSDIESALLAMDVLLMPSHREGFGVVILEAAAMGVPTVGFDVTGMKDSVVNHHTGILVRMGDTGALASAVLTYLNNPELRKQHGLNGCLRVQNDYQQATLWKEYFVAFKELAQAHGLDTHQLSWKLKG